MIKLPSEISKIVKHPEFIDHGSQGSVWKVKKRHGANLCDSKIYALKILKADILNDREKIIDRLQLLSEIRDPYITNIYFYLAVGDKVYIIMDYCPKGHLLKVINDAEYEDRLIPEDDIWKYFIQICIGLASLHLKDIVHRDIKPNNVLFDEDNNAKLADFDLSRCHQFSTSIVGAHYFHSPRTCNKNRKDPQTKESDIWALGCVLYYLCNLNDPFDGDVDKIQNKRHKPIRDGYSKELKSFVDWCLKKKRCDRPTIIDILKDKTIDSKAWSLKIDISKWNEEEAIEALDIEEASVLNINKWVNYSIKKLNKIFTKYALHHIISGFMPNDKCYLIIEVSKVYNLSIDDFPTLMPNNISEIKDIIRKLIKKSYKYFTVEIKYCIVKLRSDLSVENFGFIWFMKEEYASAIESEQYYTKNIQIITQKMLKENVSDIIIDKLVINSTPWLYILSIDREKLHDIISNIKSKSDENLYKAFEHLYISYENFEYVEIIAFLKNVRNISFYDFETSPYDAASELLSSLIWINWLREPQAWIINREIIKTARILIYPNQNYWFSKYQYNRIAKNIKEIALKAIVSGFPDNEVLSEIKRLQYALELVKKLKDTYSDDLHKLMSYLERKNLNWAIKLQASFDDFKHYFMHSNLSMNSFALDYTSELIQISKAYDMLYRFLLIHKESDWELLYGILYEIEAVILDDSVDLEIRNKLLQGETDENPGFLYFAGFNKYKVKNNWRIREKAASGLVKISNCDNELLRNAAREKLEERMKRETNKKVIFVFEHQDVFIEAQKVSTYIREKHNFRDELFSSKD